MDDIDYLFKLNTASVIGRSHVEKHMNNQDSISTISADDFFIAVISDGCSACKNSEIGSYLTAHRTAKAILDRLGTLMYCREKEKVSSLMEEVRLDVSSFLRSTSAQLGPTMHMIVDSMLATAAGFVVMPDVGFFFSIGDGKFFVNNREIELNSKHAEYPDMVVYQAVAPDNLKVIEPKKFCVSDLFYTDEIESFVVASDGLDDFIHAEGKPFPGMSEIPIPHVSALWAPNANPLSVLRQAGRTVYRADFNKEFGIPFQTVDKSPLFDDTSIVILRRV